MTLINQLLKFPRPIITESELEMLMNKSANSRYSKVKRFLAQGKLLRIRRGVYCITDALGYAGKPNMYELAQYIYGPSYISFESALSYHGLIPERVYTTTSATSKRSKEFQTPLGIFSYLHLPEDDFYMKVDLLNEDGSKFFMATPWKAICDYIYCYKKNWKSLSPLIESFRIDVDQLPILTDNDFEILNEYYKSKRIEIFLFMAMKEQLNKLEFIK